MPEVRIGADEWLEHAQRITCPNCGQNDQLVVMVAGGVPRVSLCGTCQAVVSVERCAMSDGSVAIIENAQRKTAAAFDSLVEWWTAERPAYLRRIEEVAAIRDAALAAAELPGGGSDN